MNDKIEGKIQRREFLNRTALTTASFFILPRFVLGGKNYTPPSDKIVLGFIGVGKRGKRLEMEFLREDDTAVLAGCDVDALKLNRFKTVAEKYYTENSGKSQYKGILAYEDYRELLENKEIDAVVISTPDHWHSLQVVDAAKAGKDIFCEKPMAHTVEEGRAMVKAVEKNNRIYQNGNMQRSWGNFRKACELVRNGYIGEVKEILVSIGGPPVPCDLPSEPIPDYLNWDLWNGPAPERGYNAILSPHISNDIFPKWRLYEEYGGGMVTDWGAHMFDIAQWGLGMDKSGPVEFIPPKEDNAKEGLIMKYENGIKMTHKNFDRGNAVRFIGTEGSIDISRGFFDTTPEKIRNIKLKESDTHLYESVGHNRDWLDSIRSRKQPICDAETGHRTSSLCNVANIAYKLKRPLEWRPDKEKFRRDRKANKLLGKKMRKGWRL